MSDLVEFLRARLDDDAAYIQGGTCNCWQPTDNGQCANLPDCPARVLAEVEAKRRIMDEHAMGTIYAFVREGPYCTADDQVYPCQTLRLLALPYADHDDYREEWRP